MEFFGFYIEFASVDLLMQNPLMSAWFILNNGGWLVIAAVFIWGIYQIFINNQQGKYKSKWEFVLLAIDIPRENEQSPKAVENIFAQLSGIHTNPNFVEKNILGKCQEYFSFEIISIDGYIQFLVYTPVQFRDLVEASIYAQYPQAVITEVEDYADKVPQSFPDEDYKLWGTELVLYNKDVFPIKTYPEFEHIMSQELKDPMAALLEIMSKLNPGEQVWLQLVITPVNDDWKKSGLVEAKKTIGVDVPPVKSKMDKAIEKPVEMLGNAFDSLIPEALGGTPVGESKKDVTTDFSKMFKISPGERKTAEAVERKISKIGFQTKFRMIYLGKKEVFSKGRGVSAVVGAIKQFNTQDMNGFKPHKRTKTKVDYFFTSRREDIRKTKLVRAYRSRSNWVGSGPGKILNTEELASIWHFPMLNVKAPQIQRSVARYAEPPTGLPTETAPVVKVAEEESKPTAPPDDLPVEEI